MRTAVLVPLALVLAAPLEAQAHTRTREKLKIVGETVAANWNYQVGDIATFVSIVATTNNVNLNGVKSEDAFVSLVVTQADVNTGQVFIDGDGVATDFTFTIDQNLNTASLNVPQMQFDNNAVGTNFNMSISLNWVGQGEITEQNFHEKVKEPGFKMVTVFKGDFRDGVATGSVAGDSQQFTPVPSETAQLQHSRSGSRTITITW